MARFTLDVLATDKGSANWKLGESVGVQAGNLTRTGRLICACLQRMHYKNEPRRRQLYAKSRLFGLFFSLIRRHLFFLRAHRIENDLAWVAWCLLNKISNLKVVGSRIGEFPCKRREKNNSPFNQICCMSDFCTHLSCWRWKIKKNPNIPFYRWNR